MKDKIYIIGQSSLPHYHASTVRDYLEHHDIEVVSIDAFKDWNKVPDKPKISKDEIMELILKEQEYVKDYLTDRDFYKSRRKPKNQEWQKRLKQIK